MREFKRNTYISLLLLTVVLFISSCSSITTSIHNSEPLIYSSNNKKVKILKKNKQMIIHQLNGITVSGKFSGNVPDGKVRLISRNKKDILKKLNFIKKISASNFNDDEFLLSRMSALGTKNEIFIIYYDVIFNKGIMGSDVVITYPNGIVIKAKAYLDLEKNSYINNIVADGEAQLLLKSGSLLKVIIKNNLITKYKDFKYTPFQCPKNYISIGDRITYNACITPSMFKDYKKENIPKIKRFLRRAKSKSHQIIQNRQGYLKRDSTILWHNVLMTATRAVKEFDSIYDKSEKKYLRKIYNFDFYNENVILNETEFIKSLIDAKPVNIMSKIMLSLTPNVISMRSKNIDFDKTEFEYFRELKNFSIDLKIINSIMKNDKSFYENNVYYLKDYIGSPFSDMFGNIYLSEKNRYTPDQLYLIMLHEAIHVASSSRLRDTLFENSETGVYRRLLKNSKLLNNNSILTRNPETENDILLLNIVSSNKILVNTFLALLSNSNFHESLRRKQLIQNIIYYFNKGGKYSKLVSNIALLKLALSYQKPEYEVINTNGRLAEGVTAVISIKSLKSSYNIEGVGLYNDFRSRDSELSRLLYNQGFDYKLSKVLSKHNVGAYFTPTLSIIIKAEVEFKY